MQPLRDYQAEALDRLRGAVKAGRRRIVLQMPTGAGKTRLAAEIVNGANSRRKRVIFEVPAISLVDQTVEMFYAEGITEVGVIQANHHMTDWAKPIQVASAQTLMRREQLPEADVVIRDECHKLFQFDLRWMLEERWRSVPFIGLSATPWTKGMGTVYEELVVGATTQMLIDKGHLVPFRVFCPVAPEAKVDLSGVRTTAGDYNEADLSERMQANDRLTADIVATWLEKGRGRPTICFAVDRNHADVLRKRFEASGVKAAYMDCETPLHERASIRRAFAAGDVEVVCNVEVIGMGVDWPEISCISYCRPTKSEIRFVQNIGRGLRTHPGKDDLLVLDHSTTHQRMGFVTDIHHDALNDGKPKPEAEAQVRLPKECPKCGYLKPYGKRVCPSCHHESAAPTPAEENRNGKLGEFKGRKKRPCDNWSTEQRMVFFAELKGYAKQHGYKDGWASQKYRSRFDKWPANGFRDVPAIASVSAETLGWIRSENIRWARSKNRHHYEPERATRAAQIEAKVEQEVRAMYGQPAGRLVDGTLCTEQDLADFV